MKVQASLSGLGGCQKPKCQHLAPLNRHHKGHEALWLGVWAHRVFDRPNQRTKWRVFVRRYHEFRDEDCCLICLPHHAEIHSIYDAIIADDIGRTGLRLSLYSWKQARILMQRLKDACDIWLRQETPGIDSDLYERAKKRRRGQLIRYAKERHPQEDKKQQLALHRQRRIRAKRPPKD